MKKCDHTLDRLFRAAAGPTPTSEMPFGFDTRGLALARESLPNGSAIAVTVPVPPEGRSMFGLNAKYVLPVSPASI